MRDRFGREIDYLRISVTHNCNLKCIYCSPGANSCIHKDEYMLSAAEFEKIIKAMAKAGIKRVRITGGEPLIRTDICEIVERISRIEGIEDLSMTTNGIKLDSIAGKLKKAGLKRLNISMDSLKPERFSYITGGGRLEDTLKGIERALALNMVPVKINVVLIKGVNDEEIDDFIHLTKHNPLEVRFIELMPIGKFGEHNSDKIINNSEIIKARPQLIFCENSLKGQPARYYKIEGYEGRVGFISPLSHKFCDCCNRIRLTCDGKIKPCLGNNGEVDIIEVMKNRPDKLDEFIESTIFNKPEGHNFGTGFSSSRDMSMIGG